MSKKKVRKRGEPMLFQVSGDRVDRLEDEAKRRRKETGEAILWTDVLRENIDKPFG